MDVQDYVNATSYSSKQALIFLRKIIVQENGCWGWSGSFDNGGYGMHWDPIRKQMRQSYRIAYELLVGPIPKHLVLGHYVEGDLCANYAHVRPITRSQNTRDGWTCRV